MNNSNNDRKHMAFTQAKTVAGSWLMIIMTMSLVACVLYTLIPTQRVSAVSVRTVSSPFLYTFNADGVLHEAGSESESSSPYFWLNSGGKMIIEQGVGGTVHGPLRSNDRWYRLYRQNNPLDTEGGAYPQNLFRFLTRSKWQDPAQEISFRIDDINTTDTPNRDGYSGVLLMSNYVDGDNLYYAGIRMDGKAVIKKKYQGAYYTLASKKVFPGTYDRITDPNLLPTDTWMRLRSEVTHTPDGSVSIVLKLDDGSGFFKTLLMATDSMHYGGGVLGKGYVGIRSDYMDLSFDNYRITD